jgi:hypothetical protein
MPQRADDCIAWRGVSIEFRDHMAASLRPVVVNGLAFAKLAFVGNAVLRPNAARHRCKDILCFEQLLSKTLDYGQLRKQSRPDLLSSQWHPFGNKTPVTRITF